MTDSAQFPAGFVDTLLGILGAQGLRDTSDGGADPGVHPDNLGAGLLARPQDTRAVAATLAACATHRVGVVPQGGRTGLAGGAVSRPGQLILSLERMQQIERIDADARTATVQAGVVLARLDEALAPHGLATGIDFAARGSATIGGMVATNAGGIDAFRYGTMRERVLGLEVALASGEVLSQLTRVRKDNAGLPLRQLFIGSEGTLGVITRVVVSVVRGAGPRTTALAVVADLSAAIRILRALDAPGGATLVAAELMSANHYALTVAATGASNLPAVPAGGYAVLFSVAGTGATADLEARLAAAAERGWLVDGMIAKQLAEEERLWHVREDWAVDRARPGGLWYDISVPLDQLADYLPALEGRIAAHDRRLSVFVIGHLGDGNLHVTVNADNPVAERYDEIAPLIYEGLSERGGSFSAEHGIGLEKRDSLAHWAGPTAMDLMRAVKGVFDPRGILNPGKILTPGPA